MITHVFVAMRHLLSHYSIVAPIYQTEDEERERLTDDSSAIKQHTTQ